MAEVPEASVIIQWPSCEAMLEWLRRNGIRLSEEQTSDLRTEFQNAYMEYKMVGWGWVTNEEYVIKVQNILRRFM